MAKAKGATVLIDGAQAMAHAKVDVQDIGCDFYVFSGHKMFAPTGVGVLWGRYELLDSMPPFLGGGDMIRSVTLTKSIFAPPPTRFEAGTPPIASVIGLGAAIDFLKSMTIEKIDSIEQELLKEAQSKISAIPGVRIIGQAQNKIAIVSFVVDEIHPHDLGTLLDLEGVAIRAGHHCTQPLMDFYKVPATVRASFSVFNTSEDIDRLCKAVVKVKELFS
jgi:cysteine desulfurase/selenocysteine lyase